VGSQALPLAVPVAMLDFSLIGLHDLVTWSVAVGTCVVAAVAVLALPRCRNMPALEGYTAGLQRRAGTGRAF
jgi:hypothetical protein